MKEKLIYDLLVEVYLEIPRPPAPPPPPKQLPELFLLESYTALEEPKLNTI
jgi:hypothetical protein